MNQIRPLSWRARLLTALFILATGRDPHAVTAMELARRLARRNRECDQLRYRLGVALADLAAADIDTTAGIWGDVSPTPEQSWRRLCDWLGVVDLTPPADDIPPAFRQAFGEPER